MVSVCFVIPRNKEFFDNMVPRAGDNPGDINFQCFKKEMDKAGQESVPIIKRLIKFSSIRCRYINLDIRIDIGMRVEAFSYDTIRASLNFLRLLKDPDTRAALLAHEMAHLEEPSRLRMYTDSREHNHNIEFRTDDRGFQMMILAGFNPAGMVNLFALLSELRNSESLTHPAPEERIRRIKIKIASLSG